MPTMIWQGMRRIPGRLRDKKCIINRSKGLGENEAVRAIYVDHAKAALESLSK